MAYHSTIDLIDELIVAYKHLQGKHDQRTHGRMQGGSARLLNVYKRSAEFTPMTDSELQWSFGSTKTLYLRDSANPASIVQGKIAVPGDLPDILYHVTTRVRDIEQSGVLRGLAGLESGGLGGHSTQGVSLTSSREDAINIKRQMRRAIELAVSDENLEDILNVWAGEDEKIANLPAGALKDAVSESMQFYTSNARSPIYRDNPQYMKDLRSEAGGYYRTIADHRGGPENILIMSSDYSKFEKMNPNDVQGLEIPKGAVFASGGAVLTNVAPGDFLHEVRVYGDIPIDTAAIMGME